VLRLEDGIRYHKNVRFLLLISRMASEGVTYQQIFDKT